MTVIKPNIKIDFDNNDSVDFIALISKVSNSMIQLHDIEITTVIKINNWFDHKWLNYSGKGIVHFENTTHPDKIAITNFWKDRITVPPFHPNRILSEKLYKSKDTTKKQINKPLHTFKSSSDNLNNRIENKIEKGLFIWFSSNSKKNQKGSLMVYRVDKDNVDSWYASFENLKGWTITNSKGINKQLLNRIIE